MAIPASLDFDGDTQSNLAEFISGTDPTDGQSYLKIESLGVAGGPAALRFFAVSNRTYGVLYKNKLETMLWSPFTNVAARTTNRGEVVLAPLGPTNRFYRL